jgi:hypothetical protein
MLLQVKMSSLAMIADNVEEEPSEHGEHAVADGVRTLASSSADADEQASDDEDDDDDIQIRIGEVRPNVPFAALQKGVSGIGATSGGGATGAGKLDIEAVATIGDQVIYDADIAGMDVSCVWCAHVHTSVCRKSRGASRAPTLPTISTTVSPKTHGINIASDNANCAVNTVAISRQQTRSCSVISS